MFKIIGALVVYGFALYGLTKTLEGTPSLSGSVAGETKLTPPKPLSAVK